jgi:KaiC/GvpD/RAD55 family RecA-like ATPase
MVNVGMGYKLEENEKNEPDTTAIDNVIKNNESKNDKTNISGTGRVSSGINGLDELMNGGFPKGNIVLISGTPGTGKTIVCFQFIQAGLKKGEKCLYLTSDQPVKNLLYEANQLKFDFQSDINSGTLKVVYLNLDKQNLHKDIEELIKSDKYDRIVMDSLSPVTELPMWMVNNGKEVIPSSNSMTTTTIPLDSIQATRLHLRHIMKIIKEENSTTMVTTEIPEGSRDLSRDSVSEFLVDGIIVLGLDTTMGRRKLTIRKMRGTKHALKPMNVEITGQGIKLQ